MSPAFAALLAHRQRCCGCRITLSWVILSGWEGLDGITESGNRSVANELDCRNDHVATAQTIPSGPWWLRDEGCF